MGGAMDSREFVGSELGESAFQRDTLLARLSPNCIDQLAARWRLAEYPQGMLVLGEGDGDADLFFLLRGAVRAAVFTLNGKEVAFRNIGPGDCFGELAAIDKGPRTASIVAHTDVIVARLASRDFDSMISGDSEFAVEMLALLAGKLRELSSRVVEYAELNGAQRVRRALLRLARENRTGLDEAVISTPPTQGELATTILVRREVVAREMASLTRRGALVRDGGALRIASIRVLEAIAVAE